MQKKTFLEGGIQLKEINSFLMFQNKAAEQAIQLYLETFRDAEILFINKHPNEADGIMLGKIKIHNLEIFISDSSVKHDFDFTPSTSFFINCEDLEELESYLALLSADGKVLMPLDNYGFSQKFAWVSDRFGISWQLNLP